MCRCVIGGRDSLVIVVQRMVPRVFNVQTDDDNRRSKIEPTFGLWLWPSNRGGKPPKRANSMYVCSMHEKLLMLGGPPLKDIS